MPTQISATSRAGRPVVTPGQIVGVETEPGRGLDGVEITGPAVDAIAVEAGAGLDGQEPGAVGMLDPRYAESNDIELPAETELAGGGRIEIVGLGLSPETFVVQGPGGAFGSESGFSPVFTSLETAQTLAGRPGRVNDLVLVLRPGADSGRDRASGRAADRHGSSGIRRQP